MGGGFTGLWAAYYLKRADPGLRVMVVEQRFAGYGASGRNGGWLFGGIAGSRTRYAKTHGREAVIALQHAMNATVDEVIDVAAREGIDADIVKGGVLEVAYTPAQYERLKGFIADEHAWGEDDHRLLSAEESSARINVANTHGGAYSPHGARIQPAKLVRGLADTVERMGVTIAEQTTVTEIQPHRVITDRGDVAADFVLRATEGFTAGIKGLRRSWLPMNSSMIVTDPLPESAWAELQWSGMETLGRHGSRLLLRATHGRRAHRHRWARRPLSLRLADRQRRHDATADHRGLARDSGADVPGRRRCSGCARVVGSARSAA